MEAKSVTESVTGDLAEEWARMRVEAPEVAAWVQAIAVRFGKVGLVGWSCRGTGDSRDSRFSLVSRVLVRGGE